MPEPVWVAPPASGGCVERVAAAARCAAHAGVYLLPVDRSRCPLSTCLIAATTRSSARPTAARSLTARPSTRCGSGHVCALPSPPSPTSPVAASKLDADYLLLDEAHDTDPVVEAIFLAQRDHAQLVMVGDSAQAIYHWSGAKDVMTGFNGTQLTLSQPFRFGTDLAAEAHLWLHLANAPIRLTGTPTVPTEIGSVTHPDAVLCRTNFGAMAHVIAFMTAGYRVALAGGGEGLRSLAEAARDPKE